MGKIIDRKRQSGENSHGCDGFFGTEEIKKRLLAGSLSSPLLFHLGPATKSQRTRVFTTDERQRKHLHYPPLASICIGQKRKKRRRRKPVFPRANRFEFIKFSWFAFFTKWRIFAPSKNWSSASTSWILSDVATMGTNFFDGSRRINIIFLWCTRGIGWLFFKLVSLCVCSLSHCEKFSGVFFFSTTARFEAVIKLTILQFLQTRTQGQPYVTRFSFYKSDKTLWDK